MRSNVILGVTRQQSRAGAKGPAKHRGSRADYGHGKWTVTGEAHRVVLLHFATKGDGHVDGNGGWECCCLACQCNTTATKTSQH